jgi:hypothetical protein
MGSANTGIHCTDRICPRICMYKCYMVGFTSDIHKGCSGVCSGMNISLRNNSKLTLWIAYYLISPVGNLENNKQTMVGVFG